MNAPILVSDALKLLSMALAQTEGYADDLGCCGSCVLARATMRPMLSAIRELVSLDDGLICVTDHIYPPLAALRDHYDQTRPDWRTK